VSVADLESALLAVSRTEGDEDVPLGAVSNELSDNHRVRRRIHPDSRGSVSRSVQQRYAGHRGAHIGSGEEATGGSAPTARLLDDEPGLKYH
jgi:hypothetical protein